MTVLLEKPISEEEADDSLYNDIMNHDIPADEMIQRMVDMGFPIHQAEITVLSARGGAFVPDRVAS